MTSGSRTASHNSMNLLQTYQTKKKQVNRTFRACGLYVNLPDGSVWDLSYWDVWKCTVASRSVNDLWLKIRGGIQVIVVLLMTWWMKAVSDACNACCSALCRKCSVIYWRFTSKDATRSGKTLEPYVGTVGTEFSCSFIKVANFQIQIQKYEKLHEFSKNFETETPQSVLKRELFYSVTKDEKLLKWSGICTFTLFISQ